MSFFVMRYLRVVSKYRHCMWLALIPALVYLVLMAVRPDTFFIAQNLSIPQNAPVSVAKNPVDFQAMHQLISHPESFFLENFALMELKRHLGANGAVDDTDGLFRGLKTTLERSMSLAAPAEGVVVITYRGGDREFGKELVGFYSRRLMKRAEDGLVRSRLRASKDRPSQGSNRARPPKVALQGNSSASHAPSAPEAQPESVESGMAGYKAENRSGVPEGSDGLIGEIEVRVQRTLWRSERLVPFLLILLGSLLAILICLGVVEWSDPSLKSERQVARYSGLPILGSLPDLNKISEALRAGR